MTARQGRYGPARDIDGKVIQDHRLKIKDLEKRIADALAACDRADSYDQGSGHWISTSEIRAALEERRC